MECVTTCFFNYKTYMSEQERGYQNAVYNSSPTRQSDAGETMERSPTSP